MQEMQMHKKQEKKSTKVGRFIQIAMNRINTLLKAHSCETIIEDEMIIEKDFSNLNSVLKKVEKRVDENIKNAILITILGGRTGTRLINEFAEYFYNKKITTICIVVTPFEFEGKRAKQKALESIDQLIKKQTIVLCLHNNNLQTEHQEKTLLDALRVFENSIAELLLLLSKNNVAMSSFEKGASYEFDEFWNNCQEQLLS
ncbi:hypothetical protein LJC44_00075 [Parabacteroides sp. OttesenSCG-928-G06]|nr:hypothetical protein [Parabacteroides sp. OttesenSCG-928-G06]